MVRGAERPGSFSWSYFGSVDCSSVAPVISPMSPAGAIADHSITHTFLCLISFVMFRLNYFSSSITTTKLFLQGDHSTLQTNQIPWLYVDFPVPVMPLTSISSPLITHWLWCKVQAYKNLIFETILLFPLFPMFTMSLLAHIPVKSSQNTISPPTGSAGAWPPNGFNSSSEQQSTCL